MLLLWSGQLENEQAVSAYKDYLVEIHNDLFKVGTGNRLAKTQNMTKTTKDFKILKLNKQSVTYVQVLSHKTELHSY